MDRVNPQKAVMKLTSTSRTSTSSTTDTDQARRRETVMDEFMSRMASIYGQLWIKKYQSVQDIAAARLEWMATFHHARLTTVQIRDGIECCKISSKFPPTHAEFIVFAKNQQDKTDENGRYLIGCAAHKRNLPALPKKPTEQEIIAGRKALKNLSHNLAHAMAHQMSLADIQDMQQRLKELSKQARN